MSTYLASSGQEQLRRTQAELYQHLLTDAAGHCRTCDETEPCTARSTLHNTILRYGSLPQRQPGLTRRPAAPPSGSRGWFASTNDGEPAA